MSAASGVALVVAATLVVPAAVLLRRRESRAAALAMTATAGGLLVAVIAHSAGAARVAAVLATAAALLTAPLVVLLYPAPRLRHPAGFLAAVALGGAATTAVVMPGAVDAMGLLVLVVVGGHVWWNVESSRGSRRRAATVSAVAVATSTLAAGVLDFALGGGDASSPWSLLPFCILGPALLLGTGHSSTLEARALAVVAVAHVATAVGVLAVFAGVAAPLLDRASDTSAVSLLSLLTVALALGYRPAHRVLHETVSRVVLGPRPDPLTAVGLVTRRVGDRPEDALLAVRQALALPWASIRSDPPVSSGVPTSATEVVALGQGLPDLELGLRDGDEHLPRADRRVLNLAAPLLGQSLRLQALADQLSASRSHSVAALAEERRRLRRDLHDGLGPLLSGLAFTTDAARNLVRLDPDAAETLLDEVRAQAGRALDDIRRLVYGMRPPALDELGLVPAVRQATRGLGGPDGGALDVVVRAPALLDLPAAVEVAAYRIAVEAVTNVSRHSTARRVGVDLATTADALTLTVTDDAPASGEQSAAWSAGVGLTSMRERAAELGGRLQAGPTPTGGRVTATLPLAAPGTHDGPPGAPGGPTVPARVAGRSVDQRAEVPST